RTGSDVTDILDGANDGGSRHFAALPGHGVLRELVDELLLALTQDLAREAAKVPENPEQVKALRESRRDVERTAGRAQLQQPRTELLRNRLHVNSTRKN